MEQEATTSANVAVEQASLVEMMPDEVQIKKS